MHATWRRNEQVITRLETCLEALAKGRGAPPLLLCGLRGSGRDALAASVVDEARQRGFLVVRCTLSAVDALFGAVTDATASLVEQRPGALAVRRLREQVERLEAQRADGGELAGNEVGRLLRLLYEATEEARTTLVVQFDDAPRAAPGLLALIAKHHDLTQPVLHLACALPIDETPDGWERHDLGPLPPTAVRDIGQGLSPEHLAALLSTSGGWPDLLEAALTDGAVHDTGSADIAGRIGEAVRAAVEALTGPLTSPELRYLRTLLDLADGDGSVSVADVGRALGDTTRFSDESSALAQIRSGLLQREVLFQPSQNRLRAAIAGLELVVR